MQTIITQRLAQCKAQLEQTTQLARFEALTIEAVKALAARVRALEEARA